MSIQKHFKCSKKEYAQIHQKIRRKLEREAFIKVYNCNRCGSKVGLQIHIPNPDPKLIDQPGFYEIVCMLCHSKIPKTKT